MHGNRSVKEQLKEARPEKEVSQTHWFGGALLLLIVAVFLAMVCGTVLGSVYLIWGQC